MHYLYYNALKCCLFYVMTALECGCIDGPGNLLEAECLTGEKNYLSEVIKGRFMNMSFLISDV